VNESTSFCFTPAPKETYACVCGGTGLVRWGGTSPVPATRGCDNNATSSSHAFTLELSGVGGDLPSAGRSALSIYANGSECGPVPTSAHENGADVEGGAASEIGECNDAELVAKADQGEREEDPPLVRVTLPDSLLVMRAASECDVSESVTEEDGSTVLPSMVGLGARGRLTGNRRGCSPDSSGGRAGPCKKLATVADAVPYNHAIGTGSLPAACSAVSTCFCVAGPEESSTGSPTGAFPLLMEGAVSRKLVYPPPDCGGSMSMSCIRERSMTMSPLIAQPPVPYPPALTDGKSPCLLHKMITLSCVCQW
jgi:hypothetical protein